MQIERRCQPIFPLQVSRSFFLSCAVIGVIALGVSYRWIRSGAILPSRVQCIDWRWLAALSGLTGISLLLLREKLCGRMREESNSEPLLELPDEVWVVIMGNLSIRDALTCRRVSQSLKRAADEVLSKKIPSSQANLIRLGSLDFILWTARKPFPLGEGGSAAQFDIAIFY